MKVYFVNRGLVYVSKSSNYFAEDIQMLICVILSCQLFDFVYILKIFNYFLKRVKANS